MAEEKAPAGWSTMHDLSLVYLALTQGSDSRLDADEERAMARKLQEWFGEDDREPVLQAMEDAGEVYGREDSAQMVRTAIDSIGTEMNRGLRIAVWDDLSDIASADGRVVEGEVSLINQLAEAWGIEKEME